MSEASGAPAPFIQLRKSLHGPLPEPRWPAGLRLAPFDPGRHPAPIHALLAEAYARGGGAVGPLSAWWEAVQSDVEYDPALVFLAVDEGGQPAGVALCWTSAYLKDLAVAGPWRRRGLGEALLRYVFCAFQARGAHRVDLKVEVDNPSGAERLYRRLGMEPLGGQRLRLATPEDAPALARVFRLAMRHSLSFLPELHTPEEDRQFMARDLLPGNEVWVGEVEGEVVGYIAFHPGWVEHLYLHPDHQGLGLGPALLARALADGSERRLWTFQQNVRARTFYEQRGFVAECFTDGARNEERTPDVCYRWPGRAPAGGAAP